MHLCVDLPWPLAPRDLLLYGFSADDLADNGRAIVFIRNWAPDDGLPVPVELQVPRPDTLRADVNVAGLLLTPLENGETAVCMLANVDPKLAVPYWLLNFVTRNAAPMMLNLFGSLAADIRGTHYEKRIAEDRMGFYRQVRSRLGRPKS